MAEHKFCCDICGHPFTRDKISLAEDNEFGLDLCGGCLEGQREVDAQEIDFDLLRDSRKEIRELQKLERRQT